MKLSIIIVNYNVEHFLEQCLLSVRKACEGIDAEVIVVDNASVDGSLAMLEERFSDIHLIANTDNRGFSRANNQGIKISQGEYVLLLNPDTVVEEETFSACIKFMDEHTDAGGLGVRMLDGKGIFLPESKRGLPTPEVAFYKIFGLSKLFPSSKRFGRYHLGYLDEFETHPVEILSGAYMFMRKSALDKVGMLDEEYFMYGEDIDLSYRLIKGGYANYYFPEARIIHYKGESTKKTSVNYVFVFYNAMRIFARKHFSAKHARSFNKLIEAAIYVRAGLSLLKRFLIRIAHPLLDFILVWIGLYMASVQYQSSTEISFPSSYARYALPAYALLWVICVFLSSGYERPLRLRRRLQGTLIGTAIILILYALLPEEYRFSRAMILLGSLSTAIILGITHFIASKIYADRGSEGIDRRYVVLGSKAEQSRIGDMMTSMGIGEECLFEGPTEVNLERVKAITEVHAIDEVIFCAKDISAESIIDMMSKLDSSRLDYKIAPPESLFIIGSNSKDNSGDFLTYEINAIAKPVNKRNKRLFDFGFSLLAIIGAPILCLLQRSPLGFFKNLLRVITARATWVGYHPTEAVEQALPELKESVIQPEMREALSTGMKRKLNLLYAKDYSVGKDLDLVLKHWRDLGA